MSAIQVNEPIWFYQWQTDHHQKFDAIVRVIPGNQGGVNPAVAKVHVTIYQEELTGGRQNINNIDNTEIIAPDGDLSAVDYWRRRFSEWQPA